MRARRLSALTASVATLGLLSACSTWNPYTREQETSKAAKGAVIGATAGAAIGALTGDDSRDRRKRALIGAGIGALTGGSVGYYMDLQEARLRKELDQTGVSVTRDGDNIALNMPGNITFQVDRADLKPAFYDVLRSVALVTKKYEKTMIEVEGHTDSSGPDDYNLRLSERRAATVESFLTAQGVQSIRIFPEGRGESDPVANNDSPEGRQLNRRVELTLVPIVE